MPIYEFCQMHNVDQSTTWRWKHMPDFALKVRERRIEIMPLARESMWFNQLHLLGMQTQDKRAAVDALKTLTGHFSDLQTPTQRQQIELKNNVGDLLKAATTDGIIEGEVVDATNHATPNGADASALSLPS